MKDFVYIMLLASVSTVAIVGWAMMISYKKAYWRMHGMWKDMATLKKEK